MEDEYKDAHIPYIPKMRCETAEFDRFMEKVNKMEHIMTGLKSKDREVVEQSLEEAQLFLEGSKANQLEDLDEDQLRVTTNKSSINQKAFDTYEPDEPGERTGPKTMDQEIFMKQMEDDARQRAEQRRQRKITSDRYKTQANSAFRNGEYHKALNFYNKAIEHTKDSPLLYSNRALTYIKLGLLENAKKDCDKAIQIHGDNLRARLYKAHALYLEDNKTACDELLKDTYNCYKDSRLQIEEYTKQWYEK